MGTITRRWQGGNWNDRTGRQADQVTLGRQSVLELVNDSNQDLVIDIPDAFTPASCQTFKRGEPFPQIRVKPNAENREYIFALRAHCGQTVPVEISLRVTVCETCTGGGDDGT